MFSYLCTLPNLNLFFKGEIEIKAQEDIKFNPNAEF